MLKDIAIACCLLVLTTFIHASAMAAAIRGLSISHAARQVQEAGSGVAKATVVAALAIVMFLASMLEAALWAVTYLLVGAIQDFETSLYFSTVTYTTLGFGDVVMERDWRLLSSFQAANGIMMFGWTTAMIVAAVQRLYGRYADGSTQRD